LLPQHLTQQQPLLLPLLPMLLLVLPLLVLPLLVPHLLVLLLW
jgi:hypothetical protein